MSFMSVRWLYWIRASVRYLKNLKKLKGISETANAESVMVVNGIVDVFLSTVANNDILLTNHRGEQVGVIKYSCRKSGI